VLRHCGHGYLLAAVAANDGALPCGASMAKAGRVLAALKRDGWVETRRSGSHRVLAKPGSTDVLGLVRGS
jgi:hypothetical protein